MSIGSKPKTTAKTSPASLIAALSSCLDEAGTRLPLPRPLALAVSGGGDSVAMMHLMAQWCADQKQDPGSIFILTVDHGLRADAAQEAVQVATWAAAHGFHHQILEWEGDKPQSRIQEQARAARYDLMCGWCADHGIRDLLLAHTASDQRETVGMRLLKGSGTKGLAGIQVSSKGPRGVRLLRPLLGVTGDALRNWLAQNDRPWLEDPSNQDRKYERIRMRDALGQGTDKDDGGDSTDMNDDLDQLNMEATAAREAMDNAVDDLLRDGAQPHTGPWVQISRSVLASAPQSIASAALSRMIHALGGAAYQPSQKSLEGLMEAVADRGFKTATLGRCVIAAWKRDFLILGREGRNLTSLDLAAGECGYWDNRIQVQNNGSKGLRITFLGDLSDEAFSAEDWLRLKDHLPFPLRAGAMVLEFEGGLMAVPGAEIGDWPGVELQYGGFPPFGPQDWVSKKSTAC